MSDGEASAWCLESASTLAPRLLQHLDPKQYCGEEFIV